AAQLWLSRALELVPVSPLVNFYIGEVLYNRGANEDAITALRRSIELSQENPDAQSLLSFVLGDLGRHGEARAATGRVIQLIPSLSRAQANLSLDRYNHSTYEELVPERQQRHPRERMEVAREGGLAHYNLGLAFRRQGYYAEALREYRIALERDEDRLLVLQAMAELHLLKRDSQAAIELYDRILEEQSDSPKLWCERGVALHQDGRHVEAEQSYRRALEIDPLYAIAHNNLGVASYHAGNSESAMEAFRAALAAQPSFVK